MNNVAISLVAYHSKDILLQSLAPLLNTGIPIHIWVNGEDDGIISSFDIYENVVIRHANGDNIGFGSGHNRNLEYIEEDYTLILNPDCFISPQQIEALISASKSHENTAITGPVFVDGSTNPRGYDLTHSYAPLTPDGEMCVEYLSGACMLFDMKIMREIGFFDENIFLFYEDDEICWRVRQQGKTLLLSPSVKVRHLIGESSGKKTLSSRIFCAYHQELASIYYFNKALPDLPREVAEKRIKLLRKKYISRLLCFRFSKAKIIAERIRGYNDGLKKLG